MATLHHKANEYCVGMAYNLYHVCKKNYKVGISCGGYVWKYLQEGKSVGFKWSESYASLKSRHFLCDFLCPFAWHFQTGKTVSYVKKRRMDQYLPQWQPPWKRGSGKGWTTSNAKDSRSSQAACRKILFLVMRSYWRYSLSNNRSLKKQVLIGFLLLQ